MPMPRSPVRRALCVPRTIADDAPMKRRPLRIRVMAEYGSSGLWSIATGGAFRHGMLEHAQLDLPPDLCRRFATWIATYEEHNLAGTLDHVAFNREGLALATLVKAHLGSEHHVELQAEAADGSLQPALTID